MLTHARYSENCLSVRPRPRQNSNGVCNTFLSGITVSKIIIVLLVLRKMFFHCSINYFLQDKNELFCQAVV